MQNGDTCIQTNLILIDEDRSINQKTKKPKIKNFKK